MKQVFGVFLMGVVPLLRISSVQIHLAGQTASTLRELAYLTIILPELAADLKHIETIQ